MIRTISGLVDELGRAFLVEFLGLETPSALSLWIARDYIPPAWHLRLYLELKRRRLKFDCVALFGVREEDGRVLEVIRRPAAVVADHMRT